MSKDQLKEERMKILDLLSKGIITSSDAEKLLSAMEKGSDQSYAEQQVIINKKAQDICRFKRRRRRPHSNSN